MSIVPREVLQLVFLIAGPSSFGVFRLVSRQWKRVIDSVEFKNLVKRNPRCFIVSLNDDFPEEHLQFLPQAFSLFAQKDVIIYTPANFVGMPGSSEMKFGNQFSLSIPLWFDEKASVFPQYPNVDYNNPERMMLWKEYYEKLRRTTDNSSRLTCMPNQIFIETDTGETWKENIPDINLTKIKEHSEWKQKATWEEFKDGEEKRERFNHELKSKWYIPPKCDNSYLVAGCG